MLKKEKSLTLFTMAFLYLVIIFLPFINKLYNPVLVFLEQPIFILLPTLLISFYYLRITKTDYKTFFKFKKIDTYQVLLLTIIIFLLPGIIGFSAVISEMIFEDGTMLSSDIILSANEGDSLMQSIGVFFYGLFFASVFPGTCEELLFRGSLLYMMEKLKLNKWFIIILNAILFSVFHFTFIQLLHTFVLGIIISALVIITRSIWSAIYVHTAYNFIIDLPASFNLEALPIVDTFDFIINSMANVYMAFISAILIIFILKHMYHYNKLKCKSISS